MVVSSTGTASETKPRRSSIQGIGGKSFAAPEARFEQKMAVTMTEGQERDDDASTRVSDRSLP